MIFGSYMAAYMAAASSSAREQRWQQYRNDCALRGAQPKTRHEFDLELDNAESLKRIADAMQDNRYTMMRGFPTQGWPY